MYLISCDSNVKIFQQLITAVISSGRAVPLRSQFSCCRGGAGAKKCPWKFWLAGADSPNPSGEGQHNPQGLSSSISGGAARTPEGEEGAEGTKVSSSKSNVCELGLLEKSSVFAEG